MCGHSFVTHGLLYKNLTFLSTRFFEFFCFFLTIIENMPYRTQISPQNSRKERISRSFLKPLRGYDGFNSLLYHLGNLCCLHSLVFLIWDRVEKMDFYRYGTDGIGVKRNKTVFLTQPARSGILLLLRS
mgnify:CR=1 FL=1